MKDNQEVIKEFNELVNMTASDLEKWLQSDDSNSAGWPKETEGGETVGHDSGRKIVEILNDNPKKDPKKYTEDQVTHMRKVVAYCKRHLAQETKGNNDKSAEEVKKTKSYASLKNWGHDFLKAQGKTDDKDTKEDEGAEDDKAGDKRKTTAAQSGSNKKQQTQKGQAAKKDEDDDEDEDEDEDEKEPKTRSKTKKDEEDEEMEEAEEDEEDEDEDEDQEDNETQTKRQTRSSKKSNGQATNRKATKSNNKSKKNENDDNDDEEDKEEKASGRQNGSTPKNGPKKGDTVSWSWRSGNPEGKVLDVKAEETTITTKKGNKVTRKGDEEDPAVVLDAGSSKAIKLNHELN